MALSNRSTLFLVLLSLAGFSAACDEVTNYVGENPGGYYPVGGGMPGGNGYGASYSSSGTGGDGGSGPPQCDDEYKRCAHTFTMTYGGETTVDVYGDYASDGWTVGVPMTLDQNTWSAEVDVPWDTDVQYKFVLNGTDWILDPANPNQIDNGLGGYNSLLAGITCEEWTCAPPLLGDFDWRDSVLYFVFVDRFLDGDSSNNGSAVSGVPTASNYQGGDWAGVLSKIQDDYFTDLGVNTLWLTVPMQNPDASGIGDDGYNYSAFHGYWPSVLTEAESRFGTLAEFQAVVDAAHAKDIKVIIDYAMNHVHVSSPVYTQHPGWFWDLNYNGSCVCGEGCSWDDSYESKRCWFRDYLPDFNFNVQDARDYSVSNAISWIQDTGIDGFRLDAVKHIEDQWILDLRSRVKSEIETVTEQHFYMVGETYTGNKQTIAYYVNPSTMLDGQFDFPLRAALVSSLLIRSEDMYSLENFLAGNDSYYSNGIMSTFVGNHDLPRNIHFAQDSPLWSDAWAKGKEVAWTNQPSLPSGTSAFQRVANGFTLIMTLPGVPLIYYGDEIGMPGGGDPDNRRFMQWSGLSSGQTFLRDHISKLTAIRAAHPALRRGSRTTVSVSTNTLAYRMSESSDEVYVLINRGDSAENISGLPSSSFTDALDSNSSHSGPEVNVPARTSRILIAQ